MLRNRIGVGIAVTLLSGLFLVACNSNSPSVMAAGSGQAVANPTDFNPQFNTRNERTCHSVKNVPTPAQIVSLIQCGYESKGATSISLVTDIQVETGGFRAYNQFLDGYATSIDTTAKVMPIRGSMVTWVCATAKYTPGHNCSRFNKTTAEGKCFKTTFGDWKCGMTDSNHIDGEYHIAPPTDK